MKEKPRKNSLNSFMLILSGFASIFAGIIFRKNWAAEFSTIFRHLPGLGFIPAEDPNTIFGWFEFLHNYPFIGLVFLDLFDIVNYILVLLVYFALFMHFYTDHKTISFFGLISGLIGVIIHLILNPSIRMWILKNQYYSTSNYIEQIKIIDQGSKIMENYRIGYLPSTPMAISLLIFALAGLIFSILIIKDKFVKKWLGIFGIVAYTFLMLHVILITIIPDWSYLFVPSASIFLMIWHIGIGIKLVKHGKNMKYNRKNSTIE